MGLLNTNQIQDEERQRCLTHYEKELEIAAFLEREEHTFTETWQRYGYLVGTDDTVASLLERAADRLVGSAQEILRRSEKLRPVPFPTARFHSALQKAHADYNAWAEATAAAVAAAVGGATPDWNAAEILMSNLQKSRQKASGEEQKFRRRLGITPEEQQTMLARATATIESDRWTPRARPRATADPGAGRPTASLAQGSTATTGGARDFSEAVATAADRLVAGSLALIDDSGREELRRILKNTEGINWNAIGTEYLLLSLHLMDRYAVDLYGPDIREKIMSKLGIQILTRSTKSGAMRIDDLGGFYNLFMSTLRQREAAYNKLQLDSVMREEISMALDGIVLDDRQRTEEFAHYYLAEKDVLEVQRGHVPGRQNSLLWQFAGRIAFLLGQGDSGKVIAHVHNFTIDSLVLAIHPVRELENMRGLLEAGSAV